MHLSGFSAFLLSPSLVFLKTGTDHCIFGGGVVGGNENVYNFFSVSFSIQTILFSGCKPSFANN